MRLPDPERSYAILIGTSTYRAQELEDLPTVDNNILALARTLTHPSLGSLASDHCIVLQNPLELRSVYRRLRRYAALAEDTLVVYFAGHGRIGLRNELYLALTDTDTAELPVSALPLELLRDALAESPAANRVLILDCCFSGRAIPDLSGTDDAIVDQVDIEGTYTLTATSANAVALAPVGAEYTAFTGELLGILEDGITGGPELLTFGTLFPRLLQTMTARRLPAPKQRGIGTADRLALTRNPAYVQPQATSQAKGLRRKTTTRLPENLEILLSDEPVLDVYSYGPWRVPDGLYEEMRQRALALNQDERATSLSRTLSDFYGEQTSVVGAELWSLLTFLLGASAIRGGSFGDVDYEILAPFLASYEAPVRDPLSWFTQGGRWRPPGLWLPESAGDEGELRQVMYALARECLELYAGIEPIERRRQALIEVFDHRRSDPDALDQDLRAPQNRLETLWADNLDDETLATLPELAGTLGYLEWACAGFAAAHERMINAAPGGDSLNTAFARLLLQAEVTQLPAELSIVFGPARYQAITEHIEQLREEYSLSSWQSEVRGWLAHGLVADEANTCRAWLDMAVRVTGAVQGLPDKATSPRCRVPVRQFQHDLRRLFRSRSVNAWTTPLAGEDSSARRRRNSETAQSS